MSQARSDSAKNAYRILGGKCDPALITAERYSRGCRSTGAGASRMQLLRMMPLMSECLKPWRCVWAGSTDGLTHRSTCSEGQPLRDLPLTAAAERRKGARMTNRRRHHAICLRLTDAEFDLWTAKQKASGLSKTDYLMQAIGNSEVRIYSVEESIAPIVHEIRKIGTNLNQLAYFSNIGQDERVKSEIGAIRQTNDAVMSQLSYFLKHPHFTVKAAADVR